MQKPSLNTQLKKSLRGVAHHLDPVVAVSERGITDGIIEETERALVDHEVIKVKVFSPDRAIRGAIATALAQANIIDRLTADRQSSGALSPQSQSQS